MKTYKLITVQLIAFVILGLFTSCDDWDLKGIRGEGPIVTEDYESFSKVEGIILEIPASVYIEKGEEQSIRIEAQQNILDNIITTTFDDLLRVKFDEDVSRCEPIKIYMTIASLKGIDVRGSGEVVANQGFSTEENLYINISGSGSVFADANANEVDMNISGSGDIELKTICESIYSNISGSGDVRLTGACKNAEFNTSGSGDVMAYKFEIETCKINIVGSGDAQLNVSEFLSVSITGSGDVHYIGNPALSVNITGSGDIVNAN